MVAFIDTHRDAYRVEPICRVLPIAPSTYVRAKAHQADPTGRSARTVATDGPRESSRRTPPGPSADAGQGVDRRRAGSVPWKTTQLCPPTLCTFVRELSSS